MIILIQVEYNLINKSFKNKSSENNFKIEQKLKFLNLNLKKRIQKRPQVFEEGINGCN